MTISRSRLGQGCYLLGSILVTGNPGAMAFGGEAARTAALALGLSFLIVCCVLLSSLRKSEVYFVFLICSPLPAFEVLVRLHAETLLYDNALAFRVICYLYYISGVLIGLSLRNGEVASRPLLIASIAVACILSLGYLASLSATQFTAGRETIDEGLNAVGIAYSFGITAITVVGILLTVTANFLRYWCLATGVLATTCMLFTASRGALVALVLTIGFYMVVRIRFDGALTSVMRLKSVGAMSCAVLVFITIWSLFGEILEPQLQFVERRFTQGRDTSYDTSMEVRSQIRGDYLDHVDEWWLLGYDRYDGTYPHNLFLEAWIRFGLFGFLICAAIAMAIVRLMSMSRVIRHNVMLSVITLQGLFTLINAQTNLSMEFERSLWAACGSGLALLFAGDAKEAVRTRYG